MCQMQVLAKTLNVAVLPSTILAAFVLVIVLAALTTDILKSLLNLTGYYLKQIFQLFGSFLLFNYLILILKQGILHPKTF